MLSADQHRACLRLDGGKIRHVRGVASVSFLAVQKKAKKHKTRALTCLLVTFRILPALQLLFKEDDDDEGAQDGADGTVAATT